MTSHRDYVIIAKKDCRKMSMLQIMAYCRSLDRRWLDVTTANKPMYRHYQKDCKSITMPAKHAETSFRDADLLTAEKAYERK